MEQKKQYISASRIKKYWQCGYNYYLYYIREIRKPPGTNLVFGSALHYLAQKILIEKCRNSRIMKYEEIEPYVEIAWGKQKQDRGIKFSKEEEIKGEKKVESELIETLKTCVIIYLDEFAPIIQPINEWHIEREVMLEIEGFNYDIKCIFDVIEEDGFRDLKSAKVTPNQSSIDKNSQYTFYALAFEKTQGLEPKIWQDTVVKLKKPKGTTLLSSRTVDDYNVLIQRMEIYVEALEKGVFIPASETDFMCSEKMCDYWENCKYRYGCKSFALGSVE